MSDYDWAAEQGDKWLAHLSGLEAMMKAIDDPLLSALALSESGEAPMRIADIACGGGGTTFEIEKRASQSSVIHGFDISNALVESANARAAEFGSQVVFQSANLQTMSLSSEPYDYLVSRFGTMFFDDPSAAFSNIQQWLKPQGQFAFAVWGDPKQNPWMSSLRGLIGEFIELPKPEPDAPGPFRYAETDLLLGELSAAGFKDLVVEDWRGQLPMGGGLDAAGTADFAMSMFGLHDLLIEAGEPVLKKATKALIDLLKTHEQGGIVSLDAYVHIVSGARS